MDLPAAELGPAARQMVEIARLLWLSRLYGRDNPVLILDNRAFRLAPGACGLIPVGMKQAWLGPDSGTGKWIDMNTPVPRGVNFADDTYFLGPPPQVLCFREASGLLLRHIRSS